MPSIIDVVASRVSRDLTRQKLTQTFRERPTTAKGLVLGKQLAQINGTPTPTALDDEDLVQTVVEFTNIGRPSVAIWATAGGGVTQPAGAVAVSTVVTGVNTPYVPATRRINTIWPVQGGADLGSDDLTLYLAENSVTAEALAAVIADSNTIDVEVTDETIQFSVKPGTIDADTLDGLHAAEIMATVNEFPEGTTTGDILRWDATTEEWVVAHEPLELAGAILTPMASMNGAVEGAIYYHAATGHILVYTTE